MLIFGIWWWMRRKRRGLANDREDAMNPPLLQPVPLDVLARLLYSLNFPRKDFGQLPESVQAAYRTDAARMKRALQENGYVAKD